MALSNPPGRRAAGVPALAAADSFGAAADRYARLMLRKSAQTQATYLSTYRRFTGWLIEQTGQPDPSPSMLSADLVAAYITKLEIEKAPATVKKERAAINRLAKYLHTIGAIDATEILMIEGSRTGLKPQRREALDDATWRRVKDAARARLAQGPKGRSSRPAALRDLAIILTLGGMGLRSEEVRMVRTSSIGPKRSDGLTPWVTVHGKGDKTRELPIPTEVAEAVLDWLAVRQQIVGSDGILFARLGRERRDGSFPDAQPDERLSSAALREIVGPIMLAAGVPAHLAHPHVLRHTYGTLFMRRPHTKIEQLQTLMGHSDISTTSVYLHHTAQDLEAAVAGPGPRVQHPRGRRIATSRPC